MADSMRMDIDDGIIIWYDGPEWDEVAAEAFRQMSVEIETYAKNNAPWEDRTGDARAGLNTEVDNDGNDVILSLEHGVDYGYWLEVIQSGRFAIIQQTLEMYAPMVMATTVARLKSSRQGKRYL